MQPPGRILLRVLVLLAALVLAGCATSPAPRLYVLRASDPAPGETVLSQRPGPSRIAVARVRIPAHLDRPMIVTEAGEYELNYSEFERWAAPLADNLTDVLTADLAALLPGTSVWSDRSVGEVDLDFLVDVEIQRLTGRLGDSATLVARWGIVAGTGRNVLHTDISRYRTSLSAGDHATYVAAVSDLVLDLARDIATALQIPKPADAKPARGE